MNFVLIKAQAGVISSRMPHVYEANHTHSLRLPNIKINERKKKEKEKKKRLHTAIVRTTAQVAQLSGVLGTRCQ